MSGSETSNTSNGSSVQINPNDELFIFHSDPPNYMLATKKLNGENFAQWKRSAEISLIANNKIGFVKGTCVRPADDSSDLNQWERCNNLEISWILHSVEPSIASSILYCKTAYEIWHELVERFGQSNAPRLYQLQKDLVSLEQGDKCVSAYFTQLKTLWDEYLTMVNLPICSCGAGNSFVQFIQNQQLLQFLMGLNNKFKTARGNILMMNPLPNLSQAYRLILQEERQRECSTENVVSHESVAFVANRQRDSTQQFGISKYNPSHVFNENPQNTGGHNSGGQNVIFGISPSGKRSKFFCQHCRIWGHSLERCFKVNPPLGANGNNFKGKRVANVAYTDGTTQSTDSTCHTNDSAASNDGSLLQAPLISQQQYAELIKLLNQQNMQGSFQSESQSHVIGSAASVQGPSKEAF